MNGFLGVHLTLGLTLPEVTQTHRERGMSLRLTLFAIPLLLFLALSRGMRAARTVKTLMRSEEEIREKEVKVTGDSVTHTGRATLPDFLAL